MVLLDAERRTRSGNRGWAAAAVILWAVAALLAVYYVWGPGGWVSVTDHDPSRGGVAAIAPSTTSGTSVTVGTPTTAGSSPITSAATTVRPVTATTEAPTTTEATGLTTNPRTDDL